MKLIQILRHLDHKTLEKAGLFVSSPYYNTNSRLTNIFQFIKEEIKKERSPEKEQIWNSGHPNVPYDDVAFRKIIHKLLKLLQDFFAAEHLASDSHLHLRAVAQYCDYHDIHELRNKLQKDIRVALAEKELSSSESIYDLYTTKRHIRDIVDMFKRKKDLKILNDFIYDLDNDITVIHLIEKLRIILLQNNFIELGRLEAEVIKWNPTDIERFTRTSDSLNNAVLRSFYMIYRLRIKNEVIDDFNEIIDLLEIISKSNKTDASEIYSHLYNHLGKQINLGNDLYAEWFELLKFGLRSELLLVNGKIDPIDYRNIVIAACRQKEYDWALSFVEDYKKYLSIEYRQSAYSFSKARIHNNNGNHGEVIKILRNVEYEDITYNLNSRLMLIMAFYELDEYETLDSTIKSFKVFLRRRRDVSAQRKENFQNFCDVVYNLVRAGDKKDTERLFKATDLLSTNPGIPSSWWLKEKIAELSIILGLKEKIPLQS